MSKKHFIMLADFIKDAQGESTQFSPDQIMLLARFCSRTNPRFDRDRWIDYINGNCGPSGGSIKK
jgi:hypothetical protein